MKTILIKFKIFLFAVFVSLTLVHPAFAARFFWEASSIKVDIGQEIDVALFLDGQAEFINAVQGTIVFSQDIVQAKNVSDGGSIINLWIEKPKAEAGLIKFSGITPGGFAESKGLLLKVRFLAKKAGVASLSIKDQMALVNDGQGTAAKLKILPLLITVSPKVVDKKLAEVKDNTSPEDFSFSVASDPDIFDGKKFITFSTTDKDSGVGYYEVAEKSGILKPSPDNWKQAVSPYILGDQKEHSWIFVKAIDEQGNYKIAFIKPDYVAFWQKTLSTISGLIVIVLLLILKWKYSGK